MKYCPMLGRWLLIISRFAAVQGGRGGGSWWAHFEFTRVDVKPIILFKKIEDLREARATSLNTHTPPSPRASARRSSRIS